jgi:hypothetical protein
VLTPERRVAHTGKQTNTSARTKVAEKVAVLQRPTEEQLKSFVKP